MMDVLITVRGDGDIERASLQCDPGEERDGNTSAEAKTLPGIGLRDGLDVWGLSGAELIDGPEADVLFPPVLIAQENVDSAQHGIVFRGPLKRPYSRCQGNDQDAAVIRTRERLKSSLRSVVAVPVLIAQRPASDGSVPNGSGHHKTLNDKVGIYFCN